MIQTKLWWNCGVMLIAYEKERGGGKLTNNVGKEESHLRRAEEQVTGQIRSSRKLQRSLREALSRSYQAANKELWCLGNASNGIHKVN